MAAADSPRDPLLKHNPVTDEPTHPWNDPDGDGHNCVDCPSSSIWKCDKAHHLDHQVDITLDDRSVYVVEFDFRSDNGPRLVGPFGSKDEADEYVTSLNLRVAQWVVAPMTVPNYHLDDEATFTLEGGVEDDPSGTWDDLYSAQNDAG